jgi:sulfate/thiosulfate transport system permease protein
VPDVDTARRTTEPTAHPAPSPALPRQIPRRDRNRGPRLLIRCLALGYVFALVALPVISVVQHTFDNGLGPVLDSLNDPDLLAAARLGIVVAAVSVAVNTVFGVGMAILLVRYRFPGRRLLSALIDLPLSISPVIVGVALILVYGQQGWIGEHLENLGIRIIFSTPGIVLATVIVSLPLVVREVVPVLQEAGTEQDQAARSLGARTWQRFRRVTLPTIKWALAYGVVLSLARSLGEFGAVRVVSGSVAGESQTPTLFVNDSYQEFGPVAEQSTFTAAFALMLVAVLFIVLIAWLRPKEHS